MKKLLVLLLAFGLVTVSCNNDKGKGYRDDRNTNRDKDNYRDDNNRDKDNYDDRDDDRNKDRDDNDRGGWSSADKRQWMKVCADPLEEQMGQSKATNYCECVLEKIQRKYSSFNKANTMGTEEEGMSMGRECLSELGYQ